MPAATQGTGGQSGFIDLANAAEYADEPDVDKTAADGDDHPLAGVPNYHTLPEPEGINYGANKEAGHLVSGFRVLKTKSWLSWSSGTHRQACVNS